MYMSGGIKLEDFIILTGMSGAGKSSAMKALEDAGYYCVDNLPLNMIEMFIKEIEQNHKDREKIAISLDIRSLNFLENINDLIRKNKKFNSWSIMFMDSSDESLVKRYKETRRKHPYAEKGSIEQGIAEERKRLNKIKTNANIVIDTTNLSEKELKKKLQEYLEDDEIDMIVNVMSFGFKYGVPKDADMIFDVRMMKNPYYVEDMRKRTGLDKDVSDYVYNDVTAVEFLEKTLKFLKGALPLYKKEGRAQFVIGIGCTGGKHRSVATTVKIKERLEKDYKIVSTHRDLGRE